MIWLNKILDTVSVGSINKYCYITDNFTFDFIKDSKSMNRDIKLDLILK